MPLEALRLAAVALHPLQIPDENGVRSSGDRSICLGLGHGPLLCILCTPYLEEVLEGPFPPQT